VPGGNKVTKRQTDLERVSRQIVREGSKGFLG
jgi:hypothetical protein